VSHDFHYTDYELQYPSSHKLVMKGLSVSMMHFRVLIIQSLHI
jgi:hypothetical protein